MVYGQRAAVGALVLSGNTEILLSLKFHDYMLI